MGRRTNTSDWHSSQVDGQLAVGMHATNRCSWCGETKASPAHKLVADRCSRRLQRKYLAERRRNNEVFN
jgi:hypothetical protein